MVVLKDFQTLVVGSLGFAGVILTLFFNAYLARKARQDAIDHDRHLIRIALHEELKIIEAAFRTRIQTIADAETDKVSTGILVPLAAMTNVYDRLLDRLGLLSSTEVSKVMGAYLAVQQLPERLMLLRSLEKEDRPGFITVDSAAFRSIKEIHSSYLLAISDAIKALQREIGS